MNLKKITYPYYCYRRKKDQERKSELASTLSELDSFSIHEREFRKLLIQSGIILNATQKKDIALFTDHLKAYIRTISEVRSTSAALDAMGSDYASLKHNFLLRYMGLSSSDEYKNGGNEIDNQTLIIDDVQPGVLSESQMQLYREKFVALGKEERFFSYSAPFIQDKKIGLLQTLQDSSRELIDIEAGLNHYEENESTRANIETLNQLLKFYSLSNLNESEITKIKSTISRNEAAIASIDEFLIWREGSDTTKRNIHIEKYTQMQDHLTFCAQELQKIDIALGSTNAESEKDRLSREKKSYEETQTYRQNKTTEFETNLNKVKTSKVSENETLKAKLALLEQGDRIYIQKKKQYQSLKQEHERAHAALQKIEEKEHDELKNRYIVRDKTYQELQQKNEEMKGYESYLSELQARKEQLSQEIITITNRNPSLSSVFMPYIHDFAHELYEKHYGKSGGSMSVFETLGESEEHRKREREDQRHDQEYETMHRFYTTELENIQGNLAIIEGELSHKVDEGKIVSLEMRKKLLLGSQQKYTTLLKAHEKNGAKSKNYSNSVESVILKTNIDHNLIYDLVSSCNTLLAIKRKLHKDPEQITALVKTRSFPDTFGNNEVNMKTLFEWYKECQNSFQIILGYNNQDSRAIIELLGSSFPALFQEQKNHNEDLDGFIEWISNPVTNDKHLTLSLLSKHQAHKNKWKIYGSVIATTLLSATLYFGPLNTPANEHTDFPNIEKQIDDMETPGSLQKQLEDLLDHSDLEIASQDMRIQTSRTGELNGHVHGREIADVSEKMKAFREELQGEGENFTVLDHDMSKLRELDFFITKTLRGSDHNQAGDDMVVADMYVFRKLEGVVGCYAREDELHAKIYLDLTQLTDKNELFSTVVHECAHGKLGVSGTSTRNEGLTALVECYGMYHVLSSDYFSHSGYKNHMVNAAMIGEIYGEYSPFKLFKPQMKYQYNLNGEVATGIYPQSLYLLLSKYQSMQFHPHMIAFFCGGESGLERAKNMKLMTPNGKQYTNQLILSYSQSYFGKVESGEGSDEEKIIQVLQYIDEHADELMSKTESDAPGSILDFSQDSGPNPQNDVENKEGGPRGANGEGSERTGEGSNGNHKKGERRDVSSPTEGGGINEGDADQSAQEEIDEEKRKLEDKETETQDINDTDEELFSASDAWRNSPNTRFTIDNTSTIKPTRQLILKFYTYLNSEEAKFNHSRKLPHHIGEIKMNDSGHVQFAQTAIAKIELLENTQDEDVLMNQKGEMLDRVRIVTDSIYAIHHGFSLTEYNESRSIIEQMIQNSLDPQIKQFYTRETIDQLRQSFITKQFEQFKTNNEIREYVLTHEFEKDFQLYMQQTFAEELIKSEMINNPNIKNYLEGNGRDKVIKGFERFEADAIKNLRLIGVLFPVFLLLIGKIGALSKPGAIQSRNKQYATAVIRNIQSLIEDSLLNHRNNYTRNAIFILGATIVLLFGGRYMLDFQKIKEKSVILDLMDNIAMDPNEPIDLQMTALEDGYKRYTLEMDRVGYLKNEEGVYVSYAKSFITELLKDSGFADMIESQIISHAKKNGYTMPQSMVTKVVSDILDQIANNIHQMMGLNTESLYITYIQDASLLPKSLEEFTTIVQNEVAKLDELQIADIRNIVEFDPMQPANHYSYFFILSIILGIPVYLLIVQFKSLTIRNDNKTSLYEGIEQRIDGWLEDPLQTQGELRDIIHSKIGYQDGMIQAMREQHRVYEDYMKSRSIPSSPFGSEEIFSTTEGILTNYIDGFGNNSHKPKIHVIINITRTNDINLSDRYCAFIRDFVEKKCHNDSKLEFFVYGIPYNGTIEQYFTNVARLKKIVDEAATGIQNHDDSFPGAYEFAILYPLASTPQVLPENYPFDDRLYEGRIVVGTPDSIPDALKQKHPELDQDVNIIEIPNI